MTYVLSMFWVPVEVPGSAMHCTLEGPVMLTCAKQFSPCQKRTCRSSDVEDYLDAAVNVRQVCCNTLSANNVIQAQLPHKA